MKIVISGLTLLTASALMSTTALANTPEKMSAVCAISLDEMAKTIDADARFTGELESRAIKAMTTFSKAQDAITNQNIDAAYEQWAMWGKTKDEVDAMAVVQRKAARDGWTTSTMEPGKVYMDHVMAVNNCAEINKTDAGLGQNRDAFVATLTDVYKIAVRG